MRRASKLILGFAMAVSTLALVALDLWTKALAASLLPGRGTVRLVGDVAVLVYVRNSGAFLSLGSGLPPILRTLLLVVLPIVALAFFGWAFLIRGAGEGTGRGMADYAVLVLIAAGGAGNLFDRLLYGEVRDFLNFGIGRLRTGIMNLADLYILAALIVMALAFVSRSRRSRGDSPKREAKAE
jgi:signal peptidase II